MEYVKVHRIPNTQRLSYEKAKPISNKINAKISYILESEEISLDGVKYKFNTPTNERCKIYSITDTDHILDFVSCNRLYHIYYIIKINNGLKFSSFRDSPIHITKTGFFRKINRNEYQDLESFYDYYDVLTETWNSNKFSRYAHEIVNVGYFLLHQNNSYLDFYVPVNFWLKDFQERNPDFPQIEKYYYQEEIINNLKYSDTEIPVYFQDGKRNVSVIELMRLKSEFIYEQSLQGEIFLESFTFDDYKNQTYAFLDYLNSYCLHLILKEKMVEDLISTTRNGLR